MSNNTARLAREWAQFELDNAGEFSDKGRIAAAEHILATTTEPTMADVDWDTKKHRMAGADWDGHSPVIMIEEDYFGTIVAITDDGAAVNAPFKKDLTPNGKRYELREIGEPEHPEVLTTREDYANAPEGTIVARGDYSPYVKRGPNAWTTEYRSLAYDEDMANTARQVLRKGWGK